MNLNVQPQKTNATRLHIGTKFAYDMKINQSLMTTYFNINYERILGESNREIIFEMDTQPGIPIRTNTGNTDPNLLQLGLGVKSQVNDQFSVMLDYEAAIKHFLPSNHTIQLQGQYSF